jgi:hypothetical protein
MVIEASSRPASGSAFEPESECIKLLYDKPSTTLVAQFRRVAGNGLPIEELYLRAAGETEYRKVVGGEAQITCWDPLPFVDTANPIAAESGQTTVTGTNLITTLTAPPCSLGFPRFPRYRP